MTRYWNRNLISTTERQPASSGTSGVYDLVSQKIYKEEAIWPSTPPSLINDALALHLDANDPASHNGTLTWSDLTTNNYNGTLEGGARHTDGPFPGAGGINIDGTSTNYGLTLPSVNTIMGNGTGNWTIEFWYMTPSFVTSGGTSTYIPLIGNVDWYNGASGSFWIYVEPGRTIRGEFNHDSSNSNNFEVPSTSAISTNIWYHLAFVKQGDTIRLYFNGVQEGTVAASNLSSSGFYQSNNTLAIGRWQTYQTTAPNTTRYGIGNFSNVRIVNSAVYPDGTTFTPATTSLTAIPDTKLLTCQGVTILDASENAHTVTNITTTVTPLSGAYEFDGQNDQVNLGTQLNNDIDLTDVTVSFWAYIDSTNNDEIFVSLGNFTTNRPLVIWYDTSSAGRENTGTNDVGGGSSNVITVMVTDSVSEKRFTTANNALEANKWYNITVVLDVTNNIFYTYIDGVEAAKWVDNNTSGGIQTSTRDFRLSATGTFLDGKISEFFVYTKALSAGEVTNNYDVTKARYESLNVSEGLALSLDAGNFRSYPDTGTKWHDLSGNLRNGDLQSMNATNYYEADGGYFLFDGSNDYVSFTNSITLTSATFLVWAYINTYTSTASYIFSRSTDVSGLNFRGGSQIGYTWNAASNTYGWQSGLYAPLGEWFMHAVTVSPTSATVYLFTDAGLTSSTNNVSHGSTTMNAINIGRDSATSGRYVNGRISVAMIYDRALSQAEVQYVADTYKGRYGL